MKKFIISGNKFSLGGIIGILVIWQLLSMQFHPVILPSPLQTLQTIINMFLSKGFYRTVLLSFARVTAGYLLSFIIGSFLGILMGLEKEIDLSFKPILSIMQSTPNISWILLAIIWFGLNSKIVIFTIFISVLPIFTINAREGIKNVDKEFIEMADVYKLSLLVKFFKIYLPSIRPYILSAAVITIERAWKIGAMAELLSLDTGIGAGFYWARNNLETEKIFAWTIILIVLAYFSVKILGYLFEKIKDRPLSRVN